MIIINISDTSSTTPSTTTATTTSTTSPTMYQNSLLFITGGSTATLVNPVTTLLSSTEIYPRSSDCSPPSLPLGVMGPTTFVTSEPTALVATCGGTTEEGSTASCLVLDPINQCWDEIRMGSLTRKRSSAAAVTLDHIGVFILGGNRFFGNTSEFLAAGTMQWQEGPAVPVGIYQHHSSSCSVKISPSSFLVIGGTIIREFDAAIAGPTSLRGWREVDRWPALKTIRIFSGCAKIGQKVIIAGGFNIAAGINGTGLGSTEVLDLVNRRITPGGEMETPRFGLHLATIFSGGRETIFALGGSPALDSPALNSVEEWVEESSTWKPADNLIEIKSGFGAVATQKALVC